MGAERWVCQEPGCGYKTGSFWKFEAHKCKPRKERPKSDERDDYEDWHDN